MGGITALLFDADSNVLAVGTEKRFGRVILESKVAPPVFESGGVNLFLAFRGKDKILCARFTAVVLWDFTNKAGKEVRPVQSPVAFSASKGLVAGFAKDAVLLWSLDEGKTPDKPRQQPAGIDYLAFSPSGEHLAAAGKPSRKGHLAEIKVWKTGDWERPRWTVPLTCDVTCMAWTPDGRGLLTGSKDGAVRLWDVAEGKQLAHREAHTAAVGCLAFSPDGRLLATAGADRLLKLWRWGD
jgi:WD40 repeat protein